MRVTEAPCRTPCKTVRCAARLAAKIARPATLTATQYAPTANPNWGHEPMPNPNLDALIAIAEAATRTERVVTSSYSPMGSGFTINDVVPKAAMKAFECAATPDLVARLARRLKRLEETVLDELPQIQSGVCLPKTGMYLVAALAYDGSPPVAGEEERSPDDGESEDGEGLCGEWFR